MTIDEAISIMNVIVHMLEPQYDTDRIEEAVEMAIKALKQQPTDAVDRVTIKEYLDSYNGVKTELEPCKDCISREETLKALMDEWSGFDSELMDYLIEKVKKLPSVTPQPRWIPTSEKLPEKGMPVIWLMEYGDIDSDYYGMLYDRGRKYPDFFIAWMPFPEIPKLT